jgi:hypothetical protein
MATATASHQDSKDVTRASSLTRSLGTGSTSVLGHSRHLRDVRVMSALLLPDIDRWLTRDSNGY